MIKENQKILLKVSIENFIQPYDLNRGLIYPISKKPESNSKTLKSNFSEIILIRTAPKEKKIKVSGSCLPVSLMMLSGFLKKNNHTNISIIDMHVLNGLKKYHDLINSSNSKSTINPIIFGLTMVSTVEYEDVISTANELKRKFPDSIVVIGGIHPTADPISVLMQEAVDYVITMDGEVPLLELINKLNNNESIEDINNCGYRKEGYLIVNTPVICQDLDQFPFIDLDAINFNDYILEKNNTKKPTMEMITSRGCPKECIFCMGSAFGKKYRWQSVDRVIDEIKLIKNKLNIDTFYFRDSDFLINKKRCIEFANKLIEENININFQCQSDSSNVEEEVLAILKKAGLNWITFGVESTNNKCLNAIGKNINIKMIEDSIYTASKNNINIRLFFMVGLPYQTYKDVLDDIAFAHNLLKKNIIKDVRVNYLRPHPGSKIFENPGEYGITIFKHTPKEERFTSYRSDFTNMPVFETKWMNNVTILKATQKFINTLYDKIPVWGSDIFKKQ